MGGPKSATLTEMYTLYMEYKQLYTRTIKYRNNPRKQQSIFSARFYCALLTQHVSAPFGGHLQVVRKR
jgi:hypothetical protein